MKIKIHNLHNHIENPSPLQQARIFAFLETTGGKLTYLVFDSSFLSGAVAGGGITSPGLSPPGDGVGCGDGAGGGDGGAGVSFFSQPANVTAKAKRATADSDTTFFIVSSPPFLMKF
jgi:hypothetical protein